MLLSDVQVRVQRQFGDTSGAVISTDDIARWATDAQLDIVRKTKLNESDYTTATIQGTRLYAVTSLLEVRRVRIDGYPLRMISAAELDQYFPERLTTGYGQDTPRYWRATEAGVELFPTPANNLGIIVVTHTKRPAPVVNPGDAFEIPQQYHEDIVTRVLEKAYGQDGQWNAADRMQKDYKERTTEAAHDKATGGGDSYPAVRCLPGDEGNA